VITRSLTISGSLLALALAGCGQPADDLPVAADGAAWAERVTSGEWAERKLAQRTLVRSGDPAVARALAAEAAREPDLDRMHRLVGAAVAADAEAALRTLAPTLADGAVPLEQRFVLARAVVREPSARSISAELTGLARTLVGQGATADQFELGVRTLALLAPEEAVEPVRAALESDDADRRQAAAGALKDAPLPGGAALALDLADDADPIVRRRAVSAMAHYLGDPAVDAKLREVLASETDDALCTRALEAVEGFEPGVAQALLADRMSAAEGCGPTHGFVALASMRRVLRRGDADPAVAAYLAGLASANPDPAIRGHAAAALGDVPLAASLGVGAFDGLAELTSRANEPLDTRLAAIEALAALDDPRAGAQLEALASDVEAEPEQISAALRGLLASGAVGEDKAFLGVPYTSEGEDPALRAEALAWIEAVEALPPAAPVMAKSPR
jgi:HEAT repeat protein